MNCLMAPMSENDLRQILTERQIQIINDNLKAFGHDLDVGILADFNGNDWSADQGSVFLFVKSHRSPLDYPTSIGHFTDSRSVCWLVQRYVWFKQDQQETQS